MKKLLILAALFAVPALALEGDGQMVLDHYRDNKPHKITARLLAYREALREAYVTEKAIHDKLTKLRCEQGDEDARYMCNTRINGGKGLTLFEIEDYAWIAQADAVRDKHQLIKWWDEIK